MKLNFGNQIKNAVSLLTRAALGMLLLCGSVYASSFHVNVNTAPLGSLSGPFSLDFQFNDGQIGHLNNNTATVSNFSYLGGGATGSPTLFGGATGDISSGIQFDNSDLFQEVFQTFTPGTSLSFDIFLTSNVDGVSPDSFVFTILDPSGANITTTGLGDSLLLVNLDSASPSVQGFAGTGAFAGVDVTVPEPAPLLSLLIGVPLFLAAVRRKREAA